MKRQRVSAGERRHERRDRARTSETLLERYAPAAAKRARRGSRSVRIVGPRSTRAPTAYDRARLAAHRRTALSRRRTGCATRRPARPRRRGPRSRARRRPRASRRRSRQARERRAPPRGAPRSRRGPRAKATATSRGRGRRVGAERARSGAAVAPSGVVEMTFGVTISMRPARPRLAPNPLAPRPASVTVRVRRRMELLVDPYLPDVEPTRESRARARRARSRCDADRRAGAVVDPRDGLVARACTVATPSTGPRTSSSTTRMPRRTPGEQRGRRPRGPRRAARRAPGRRATSAARRATSPASRGDAPPSGARAASATTSASSRAGATDGSTSTSWTERQLRPAFASLPHAMPRAASAGSASSSTSAPCWPDSSSTAGRPRRGVQARELVPGARAPGEVQQVHARRARSRGRPPRRPRRSRAPRPAGRRARRPTRSRARDGGARRSPASTRTALPARSAAATCGTARNRSALEGVITPTTPRGSQWSSWRRGAEIPLQAGASEPARLQRPGARAREPAERFERRHDLRAPDLVLGAAARAASSAATASASAASRVALRSSTWARATSGIAAQTDRSEPPAADSASTRTPTLIARSLPCRRGTAPRCARGGTRRWRPAAAV